MLDFELAVLRALPGVNSVADFPASGIASLKLNSPNDNGVRLRLGRQLVKQTFKADISDKLQAARVLKDRMKGDSFVGEAAVLAAEEQVRCGAQPSRQSAPAEITETELEWLSNWYDEQPEPDQVTLEQANDALQTHDRAAAGGTSATQVLFEAQWLQAKLRAATTRMEKAAAEVARWKAAVEERQTEKRQRTTGPADFWSDWSDAKWKELERKAHDRRAVKLSADVPARLPSEMPRGHRNGPLDHERHGLIGSLQYWAEGSEADAAKLLISLIKRLELEVSRG